MKVFRRVLVPVDGSEGSERALARAIAIAADQHAEIHFVHVIEHTTKSSEWDEARYAMHMAGDSLLDHAVGLACGQGLLGSTAVLVIHERQRSIAQQILLEAAVVGADLIVCGAHGKNLRTNLPLGSVADELACRCQVSLMLEHSLPRHRCNVAA